jgi:hypothetical protein
VAKCTSLAQYQARARLFEMAMTKAVKALDDRKYEAHGEDLGNHHPLAEWMCTFIGNGQKLLFHACSLQ